MHIEINTDRNIEGNERLFAHIRKETKHSLNRFSERISRVEVHLSDENSDKKGGKDDLRCVMEARLEGRHPVAVTHQAATIDQALSGAVNRLTRMIESTIERSGNQRGHRTEPPPSGLDMPEEEDEE